MRHGYPRFATIRQYAGENPSTNETIRFARREMGGAFSWEEIKRYRDAWKGPMMAKGILHPADAEQAVALGIDGVWVSNHGGRQIEALVPPIDVLPGIAAAVGKRATDRLRQRHPLGPGRDAGAGARRRRGVCRQVVPLGGGAIGDDGPAYLIDLYIDELRASLGQIGALSPAAARAALVRHPGAVPF